MLVAFGAVPDVLLLLCDVSALHDVLAGLAGAGLLGVEGILLRESEGEALSAFAALPFDGHLVGEECFPYLHVEGRSTFGADSVLEVVGGVVEEAGHTERSFLSAETATCRMPLKLV